jgi:hypothetical protein
MIPLLVSLSLCVIIGGSPSAAAQSPPPVGPPQLIRMTGEFIDSVTAGARQPSQPYPTIDVRVAEKMRTFHVRDVESLTDAKKGWPILRNLGAFLIFTGPAEMIAHLQSPEATGQPLTIEGRLYVKKRVLMLNSVKSAARDK